MENANNFFLSKIGGLNEFSGQKFIVGNEPK